MARRLLPLGVVVVAVLGVATLLRLPDLKARAAAVPVGATRGEVEGVLGPPALVLDRVDDKGKLLAWVDQFWQVDVLLGPDDRVESVGRKPSDSFYRRTVGRITPHPK